MPSLTLTDHLARVRQDMTTRRLTTINGPASPERLARDGEVVVREADVLAVVAVAEAARHLYVAQLAVRAILVDGYAPGIQLAEERRDQAIAALFDAIEGV